jgi:Fic family protein
MAIDIGKLVNTVSKIANDRNTKNALAGAKNAVSLMKKNKTNPDASASVPEQRLSAEKQILQLAESTNPLSLKQIISQTSLELDEADEAVKKLVDKGIAEEQVGPDGKTVYDFS